MARTMNDSMTGNEKRKEKIILIIPLTNCFDVGDPWQISHDVPKLEYHRKKSVHSEHRTSWDSPRSKRKGNPTEHISIINAMYFFYNVEKCLPDKNCEVGGEVSLHEVPDVSSLKRQPNV